MWCQNNNNKKSFAKEKCYILFLSQSLLKFIGKATGQEERKERLSKTKGGENTENNDNYSDNLDSNINSSNNIAFAVALPLAIMKTCSIFKGRFVLGCSW